MGEVMEAGGRGKIGGSRLLGGELGIWGLICGCVVF